LGSDQFKYYVALGNLHYVSRRLFALVENRLHQFGSRPEARQVVIPAEESGHHYVCALRCRGLCKSVIARLAQQSIGRSLSRRRGFLFFDLFFNLALHFRQRFDMRLLFVIDADDVKSITTLYQVTDLSFGEREGSFLKFRKRAATTDRT